MASICDLFSARWFVRETHNLQVADRIRNVAEFLLIRGLFLIFLIAIYRAAFCRVLASVCEDTYYLTFLFCFFFKRLNVNYVNHQHYYTLKFSRKQTNNMIFSVRNFFEFSFQFFGFMVSDCFCSENACS